MRSASMKYPLLFCVCLLLVLDTAIAQKYEKIIVNAKDTVAGYYLSIKPAAGSIKTAPAALTCRPSVWMEPMLNFPCQKKKAPIQTSANSIMLIGLTFRVLAHYNRLV